MNVAGPLLDLDRAAAHPAPLIDPFARAITYLRVSVTDRCDFRCVYCMSENMSFLPKADLLSLEELDRLCSAFVAKGVRKLRLTGGEPLVRRGIMTLFSSLSGRRMRIPASVASQARSHSASAHASFSAAVIDRYRPSCRSATSGDTPEGGKFMNESCATEALKASDELRNGGKTKAPPRLPGGAFLFPISYFLFLFGS